MKKKHFRKHKISQNWNFLSLDICNTFDFSSMSATMANLNLRDPLVAIRLGLLKTNVNESIHINYL